MDDYEFSIKHGRLKDKKRICLFCEKTYYGGKFRFCGPICEQRWMYYKYGEGKDKRNRRGMNTWSKDYSPRQEFLNGRLKPIKSLWKQET